MNKLAIALLLATFAMTGAQAQGSAGGAVFLLIENDGKADRLKMATKVLNERIAAVQAASAASAASAAMKREKSRN